MSGKRTLAVRLGDPATRVFFTFLVATPFVLTLVISPWHPWTALSLLALPLAKAR